MMGLRKRAARITQPFDLWNGTEKKETTRSLLHPSKKRDKKNPLPHPGQSYNPDPEDHKRLLLKVMKKELEEQKKIENIKKVMKVKMDLEELQRDAQEEMLAGIKHLVNKADDNDDDDQDSATDTEAFNEYDDKDFKAIVKDKKVVEKRKTKQQRLKQMKDKLQRRAAKLRKRKNIKASASLKKIVKELDKKDKEAAKKRIKHKRPKNERLGQKLEKSDPIYCLTSELPSSLRDVICPMDAIVREQLEGFQSRLMVEPSKFQVKKRKYKRKVYERKVAAEQEG